MKELNAGNFSNALGTDADWPVEKIEDHFIRFVPFSRFRVQNSEYNNTVNIDVWGGRVVKADPSGSVDDKIVPFLGDPFCFGVGVEDSETFVSLINSPISYRYINLGVPGSALPDHLDIIERRHQELHTPRLYAFTFFLGNDFSDIAGYYEDKEEKEKTKDQGISHVSAISHQIVVQLNYLANNYGLLRRSYFMQYLRQKFLVIYNEFRIERLVDPIFLIMQENRAYRDKVNQNLNLTINRLVRLSQRLDFAAIFIIIPDRHQIDHALLQSRATYYGFKPADLGANLPNKMIQEKLQTSGIPYLDTTVCLAKKRDLYYIQDNHLNAAGHEAVSECISTKLNEFVSSDYADHRASEQKSLKQSRPVNRSSRSRGKFSLLL